MAEQSTRVTPAERAAVLEVAEQFSDQTIPAAEIPRAAFSQDACSPSAVRHGVDLSSPALVAKYQEWREGMALASLHADDRIKADKLVPEWERNLRTGGRDPWVR